MLEMVLGQCCAGCTRLVYKKQLRKTDGNLYNYLLNTSNYQMFMPVIAGANAVNLYDAPYVKLFPTPGVGYLQIDRTSVNFMLSLGGSLLAILPLFAFSFLLAIHSGVFIWLLVRHAFFIAP